MMRLMIVAAMAIAVSAKCGVERWSVKTGADSEASQVDTSAPSSSIDMLVGYPAPDPIPLDTRVSPQELTSATIKATLTKFKQETDSDYHLVLDDGQGNTMIAEIPYPGCVDAGSPFKDAITAARNAFDNVYQVTTSFQTVSDPVVVQGVLFFDFLHGQTGVAPNGMELHPVLSIQWSNAALQARVNTTHPLREPKAPLPVDEKEQEQHDHHHHGQEEEARHRARREQRWGGPLHVRENVYDHQHNRAPQ